MTQNPYKASTIATNAAPTRPTRWMIATGGILLALALCFFLATVLMMMWSFDSIANSSSTPKPSDLASGIDTATIPSVAVIPLGFVGLVFLIAGFVRRQPATSA